MCRERGSPDQPTCLQYIAGGKQWPVCVECVNELKQRLASLEDEASKHKCHPSVEFHQELGRLQDENGRLEAEVERLKAERVDLDRRSDEHTNNIIEWRKMLDGANLKISAVRKRLEDLEEDARELAEKLKESVNEPLALGIHAVASEALNGLGAEAPSGEICRCGQPQSKHGGCRNYVPRSYAVDRGQVENRGSLWPKCGKTVEGSKESCELIPGHPGTCVPRCEKLGTFRQCVHVAGHTGECDDVDKRRRVSHCMNVTYCTHDTDRRCICLCVGCKEARAADR